MRCSKIEGRLTTTLVFTSRGNFLTCPYDSIFLIHISCFFQGKNVKYFLALARRVSLCRGPPGFPSLFTVEEFFKSTHPKEIQTSHSWGVAMQIFKEERIQSMPCEDETGIHARLQYGGVCVWQRWPMQSRDRPLEQERVPEVPLDGGAGKASSSIDPRWCHGKASSQASDFFQTITQMEHD